MGHGIEGGHERLDWLKPILRRWGHHIEEYCAQHEHDVPYFYNERANVGILAAAAWGPGGGALEEYTCERAWDEGVSRGRADLYVYDRVTSATIEAKQLWWTPDTAPAAIRALLIGANRQAVTNRDSDVEVVAVFASLMLPPGANVQAEADRLVDQMRQADMHLIAWALPDDKRGFLSPNRLDKECLWPGVVLGLRVADGSLGGEVVL